MNYKSKTHHKVLKYLRIQRELEEDLEECEACNPEAGADLRWSIISLARAIAGLKKK